MNKVAAYKSDFACNELFHTARAAREAEFDYLMWKITQHVGAREGLVGCLAVLAHDLRGGIYPSAVTAFLAAADYLRTYQKIMNGAERDPDEGGEP